MMPSAASLSYAVTTVDGDTRMVAANPRMDGNFSPGCSKRLAIFRLTASITVAVRVSCSIRLSAEVYGKCVQYSFAKLYCTVSVLTSPSELFLPLQRVVMDVQEGATFGKLRFVCRPLGFAREQDGCRSLPDTPGTLKNKTAERPDMQASMAGWGSGLLGVLIFSGSLPATRVALSGFNPMFLTSARAVVAALLGIALLLLLRQARPERRDVISLLIVAAGVVVGFPLLTALALQHVTAAHSIVFIGLLPLATALFGMLRGMERPKPLFWVFSCTGSAAVGAYALSQSADLSLKGDLLMLAAVIVCGFGYAEGGALSRRLGGWQVISWALALSLPVMGTLALLTWPDSLTGIEMPAWVGLGYVSIFSMLVGFIFWYRGLAIGGIAGVGQLQLLQPFFGLMLASLLLHEPVSSTMLLVTTLVVGCVAGAKRFA